MPIGPSEKTWDMVALVRYPNARAYLNMKATKAYEEPESTEELRCMNQG